MLGIVTERLYDRSGHLTDVLVRNARLRQTTFSYDGAGNLTGHRHPHGIRTTNPFVGQPTVQALLDGDSLGLNDPPCLERWYC